MEDVTLDAIGSKFGTDKASAYHNYLNFYENFFAPIRYENLTILEIGVYRGRSLRTWEEYFPNAQIVGIDNVWQYKRFATDRISIEICDQSNIQQLINVAQRYGPFDIVIEDGSHMCEHQITTLRTLFPFVKPDGLYIVEDLQTNYGRLLTRYKGIASSTCVEYLKSWLDLLVADVEVDIDQVEDAFLRTYGRSAKHLTFHRRACLIRKHWSAPPEPQSKPLNAAAQSVALIDDALRTRSIAVALLAHLSYLGDYEHNGFVNIINDAWKDLEIQGLEILSDNESIEYKLLNQDGQWSHWVRDGTFVGTRGKSRFVRGAAVRLKTGFAEKYSVRTTCRFKGEAGIVTAFDGEEMISANKEPLCAIQIDVTPRTSNGTD